MEPNNFSLTGVMRNSGTDVVWNDCLREDCELEYSRTADRLQYHFLNVVVDRLGFSGRAH